MEPKVTEFFEKAKVSATHAADSASRKAGVMMKSTKLNLQIFDINTEIEILYKEIGKAVYHAHTGKEIDQQAIDVKLKLIDEKLEKIAAIREQLNIVKENVLCPNCGKACAREDVFCRNCGAHL